MGKIEGIFATNISGKVGNVVFRKNGKQNIVSQRPASVKNPRTDMQQRQRAYIKTVSSAYSVLRPICDHSFEGVAYGADSMNFFKKENYKPEFGISDCRFSCYARFPIGAYYICPPNNMDGKMQNCKVQMKFTL